MLICISKVYLHLYAPATEDDLWTSEYICCIQRKSNERLYLVFANCELLYWNQTCTVVRCYVVDFFFFLQFLHNYYCIITLSWYSWKKCVFMYSVCALSCFILLICNIFSEWSGEVTFLFFKSVFGLLLLQFLSLSIN